MIIAVISWSHSKSGQILTDMVCQHKSKWWLWCQKQVFEAWISNYNYRRQWYVITHPCPTILLLVTKSSDSDCSGSAGATVVAHGVALPLYRDCFLDLRLFNSPDLRRLVLCYCCQSWTLETVLGGNTALPRWWTARSIDADAKR